jgi:hypothetical protein
MLVMHQIAQHQLDPDLFPDTRGAQIQFGVRGNALARRDLRIVTNRSAVRLAAVVDPRPSTRCLFQGLHQQPLGGIGGYGGHHHRLTPARRRASLNGSQGGVMTTRRTFIQAAATAVPVSLAALKMGSASTAASVVDLHAVVIDADHAAARSLGRRLGAYGANVLSLREGDVTALWLNEIRGAWAAKPTAIAGLTTPSALFCFEQLAFSHGLRVVFHAEHIVLPEGRVEHQLQRGGSIPDFSAEDLARSGQRWPTRLADALSGRAKPHGRRPGPSLAALQPAMPDGATLLTSWIIAPV